MNYKEDSFLIRTYTKAELAHLYNPHVCLKVLYKYFVVGLFTTSLPARTRTGRLPRTQPPPFAETSGNYHTLFGRTVVTYCHSIQSSFTHFRKEVLLH